MKPHFEDDFVTLYHGDCLEVLRELDDNSIDAVVTDPPYALNFMGREWDNFAGYVERNGSPRAVGDDGGRHDEGYRNMRGLEPKFQDWCQAWASECLRVLKPGGHLLAFGGTRTYHRLVCGIEDAGFEIRDSLHWIYGSGFPKSMDVSKAIDKAAGASREVIAEGRAVKRMIPGADQDRTGSWIKDNGREFVPTATIPATDDAAKWEGWGTALKPAHEPIVMARKPLSGTVAQNVTEYSTGALNIDASRVTISRDDAYSNRDDNTCDTSLSREDGHTTRIQSRQHQVLSGISPEDRNDPPANAPEYARSSSRSPGSRDDYPISPCSCDEHVLPAGVGGQVFAQPLPDAREPLYLDAICGHNPQNQSMPYSNSTAPNIQNANKGRWPPNILLTHSADCQPVGTRKIKAITGTSAGRMAKKSTENWVYGGYTGSSDRAGEPTGYGDPDGMETVEAWNCAPGCPVAEMDEQSGILKSGSDNFINRSASDQLGNTSPAYGAESRPTGSEMVSYGDEGGASRFFPCFKYQAKAKPSERPKLPDGTAWPTVKPVALMQWLVRLVTPPGGTVLDPFSGTGTTAEACILEGFKCVLIERDPVALQLTETRLARSVQLTLFGDI